MPETEDEFNQRYMRLYDMVTGIIGEQGIQSAEDHIYDQLVRWGEIDDTEDDDRTEMNTAMVLNVLQVCLWRYLEVHIIAQTVGGHGGNWVKLGFKTETDRINFTNVLHAHLHYMRDK